jgi:hypothetical protein
LETTHALLALCRAWLHGGKAELDQVEDWAALRKLAGLHRLRPMVYRQLAAQADDLPRGELQWWADTARSIAVNNLQAATELVRLVEVLRGAGLHPVPFKGPCLGLELYQDLSFREFGDLDLLIPKWQVLSCLTALHSEGYQIDDGSDHPPAPRQWKAYLVGQRGAIPLINRTSRIQLDLHWRMLSLAARGDTNWNRLLSPDALSLAGHQMPRLERTCLLAYMSLHGFQHGWHRLAWLLDLAVLLSKGDAWDLKKMTKSLLANPQNRLIFLSSLCLVESMLEVTPSSVFYKNRHLNKLIGPARELAATVAEGIHHNQGLEPSHAYLLKIQLMACPDLKSKLSCLMRLGQAVGFEEVRSLRLPRAMRVFYYPYRVFRLVKKFAA